jgi:putative ABC transport system permease protein
MAYQDILTILLGFSSEELRFLEAVRLGSPTERLAFQQALATTMRTDNYSIYSNSSGLHLQNKYYDSGGSEDPAGPVEIPLPQLVLSALPMILLGALSTFLRLGLHQKLAVAVVRCATQLSLLGFILVPIFVSNTWWLTVIYTMFMLLVAAAEAVSRPAHAYDGMLFEVLVAMGIACSVTITFGLAAIVRVTPWYDAQYLIPMLGMLLGNSCSSVAVGLSAVLEELSSGKEKVEALLVLGATRVEATRDVVVRAIRLSLTPLLNSMNVVGIVSIPGMMTGQILGGSDPAVAARYQIMIFFLVALS